MINGDLKRKLLTLTIQLMLLPCKTFNKCSYVFLKEETLKENNLLVEYHKNKTAKTLTFFYVYSVSLYKNKCYVFIRTLDNYSCA